MKKMYLFLIAVCLLGLFIPALVADEWGRFVNTTAGAQSEAPPTFDQKTEVKVFISETGQIVPMPLSEYLTGVVAAEMPASFHVEALKAQAVAARSYTLNRMAAEVDHETEKAHPGADVCTDPAHCKAYLSKPQAKKNWGEAKFLEYWEKVEGAVKSTDGEMVFYENEPICAVFHSTSPGKTEDAKNVWGSPVPYLVSVESPGEEASPRFHSFLRLAPAEFEAKIRGLSDAIVLPGEAPNWIGAVEKSPSGTVLTIGIGDGRFTGGELRGLFNLRSAAFDLTYSDGVFLFSVTGYGHGVGLSQYGAEHMAASGASYREILRWYYTGVEIKNENEY